MSENSKSRGHIQPVMLNATFYVGVSKLMAKLECSKSAAVLYALNSGLFQEEVISQEDYELLKNRYGRKLKDVISSKREDSHTPVLALEQLKKEGKATAKQPTPAEDYTNAPATDYTKSSKEELVKYYLSADTTHKHGVLFELKRRGENIRDFQRRMDK